LGGAVPDRYGSHALWRLVLVPADHVGLGVAGYNPPVLWGVYIVTFVFWVGIGHAGTLISAILFLVRSRGGRACTARRRR
jgi:Ni/Fe-hydrogenase subunit HybB-like protein